MYKYKIPLQCICINIYHHHIVLKFYAYVLQLVIIVYYVGTMEEKQSHRSRGISGWNTDYLEEEYGSLNHALNFVETNANNLV